MVYRQGVEGTRPLGLVLGLREVYAPAALEPEAGSERHLAPRQAAPCQGFQLCLLCLEATEGSGCNVEDEQEGAGAEAERLREAAVTGVLWDWKGHSPFHF